MFTRRMNTPINIYKRIGGQNEDGEVLDGIRKDVLFTLAEVSKTSIKDFKVGGKSYVGDLSQNGQKPLESYKDEKVFIIRFQPNIPFDNSMFVDFNGQEYKITQIEVDYANYEYILIKGVRIS